MDIKKIGDYILKLRRKKNLTQEELARRVYVTNKAVSRWETGKSLPEVETLYLLSKELGVSVNDILEADNSTNEEIKKYYEKKTKKKLTLEIIIFVIIFIIPALLSYIGSITSIGVFNYALTNGNNHEAGKIVDEYITNYMLFQFLIPWFLLLFSYIGYKIKNNKILYFIIFLNVLYFILSLFLLELNFNHIVQIIILIICIAEIIILKKEKED